MKEQSLTKLPAHRPDNLLTPELQENICLAIKAGNYIETSCLFAGVSRSQYYKWLKRGRDDIESGEPTKYSGFVCAIEQAMAEAEVRDIQRIDRAAESGQWQAAAWRLERRYPDRWGKRQVDLNIDSQKSKPVTIIMTPVKPIAPIRIGNDDS